MVHFGQPAPNPCNFLPQAFGLQYDNINNITNHVTDSFIKFNGKAVGMMFTSCLREMINVKLSYLCRPMGLNFF